MVKIILYIAQSLDGFIATKDGSVAWLDKYNSLGDDYGYKEFVASVDTVVMGNTTYKQVLGFGEWPYHSLKSYVFAHKQEKDKNVTFVSGDISEFVKGLPADAIVWLMGGAHLINEFQKEGLIDEMILFVMPTILGSGIRLFADDNVQSQLLFTGKKLFDSGVLELRYDVVNT